jgi:hypothetical protein
MKAEVRRQMSHCGGRVSRHKASGVAEGTTAFILSFLFVTNGCLIYAPAVLESDSFKPFYPLPSALCPLPSAFPR